MASSSVNLLGIMTRDLGMSPSAAKNLFAHGRVELDGKVLAAREFEWEECDVRGRMLKAGTQTVRLVGSRPIGQPPIEDVGKKIPMEDLKAVESHEQLELE